MQYLRRELICDADNILLRRLAKMKSKLIALLLIMLLAVAGCSSGSKSNSPDDKIATINSLMSKGYEMSQDQREQITRMLAEGTKLVSLGKTEEANRLFDEAIKLLEVTWRNRPIQQERINNTVLQ